jgi:tetratricopeptide (TPR) repeat protein
VIGRVFSYPVLAQVAPQVVELEPVLRELEALEFLYPTSPAPQREYSFKHVLTQEVVYQTLLRSKREDYHERIGKALEALYPDRLEHYYDVLAYHYAHSGNAEKAVEYLDLANRKAAKANAMLEAKRYFDEAMALLDTAPATAVNQQRRIALLVNQEPVMNLLLKFPEYYELLARYEEMAVSVGDQPLLGAFYARMGGCACWFGAFDQAIPTLRKAAALCEAAGNAEDAGQAYFHWQCSHYLKGDYDQVLGLKEQVLRVLERRFHPRWYTWALDLASGAYTGLGRWDDAVEEAQKALHVAEEFADESLISFAAWCLSMAYTAKGDLAQAVASAELAVQKAPTPGDKVWAEGILAWAWCRAGEPRRGVELLAPAVAMLRASRFIWSEGLALFLGEGYWHAREYEQATRTLEELLVTAERCGMRFQLGGAHRLLGEIALVTNPGQRTEPLAARHFEQSLAILRAIGAENELALAYAGYGRFYQQQGSIAQAREYFIRALAIFERLGTLGEPDTVRQALAALPDRERQWTEHGR